MKPDSLYTVVLGVISLFLVVLGLRGVVTRKPFVISTRWLNGIVLLGFAPTILEPLLSAAPRLNEGPGSPDLLSWLTSVMSIAVVVSLWVTQRGYEAFAVTDASFREGLLASLKKLGLTHEETLGTLRLPSVGADLQVLPGWMGYGQLRMKQRQFGGLLRDIAAGMNEYYQRSTVPVNLTYCVFQVLLGVFMVVMVML